MKARRLLMTLAVLLSLATVTGATLAYLTDTDSDVNVMELGNIRIQQHEFERVIDENGDYTVIQVDGTPSYQLQSFTQEKPLYPAYGEIRFDSTEVLLSQLEHNSQSSMRVYDFAGAQDKFVVVENTGKSDAYVRTLVAFEAGSLDFASWDELIDYSCHSTWEEKPLTEPITVNGNQYVVVEFLYQGNADIHHPGGVLPPGDYTSNSLAQLYLSCDATNDDVTAIDGNGNGLYDILVLSQAVQTVHFDDAETALNAGFGTTRENAAQWFAALLTASDGVVVSTAETLLTAIEAAEDGDVITLVPGTYDLQGQPLVLEKSITLKASDATDRPVLKMSTSDASTPGDSIFHGIEINADNVTLSGLALTVEDGVLGTGNLVQISPNGSDYFSNILIENCEMTGSDHCIALYGNNVTIRNCILDESGANDQGNVIYVWGTSGDLVIQNNRITGSNQNKHGISFYHQSNASAISGNILIDGNTFTDIYKAIVHESSMTYTDVHVTVSNNTVTYCKKKPVAIDNGFYLSYTVTGNIFNPLAENCVIDNGVNAHVSADGNYWGSNDPVWAEVIDGDNVTVNNYYTDSAKTDLKNLN